MPKQGVAVGGEPVPKAKINYVTTADGTVEDDVWWRAELPDDMKTWLPQEIVEWLVSAMVSGVGNLSLLTLCTSCRRAQRYIIAAS